MNCEVTFKVTAQLIKNLYPGFVFSFYSNKLLKFVWNFNLNVGVFTQKSLLYYIFFILIFNFFSFGRFNRQSNRFLQGKV